jgi:UDP-glucuronate 4-epimerase
MQDGDVQTTSADSSELAALVGFSPRTGVHEGVRRFVDWYRAYYGR